MQFPQWITVIAPQKHFSINSVFRNVPNITDKLKTEIEMMERHLQLLDIIRREGPIGIIKLSEKTGLEQHKVRYSLRLLEKDGLIKPTSEGAMVTSKTEEFINNLRDMLKEMLKKLENIYNKAPR